MIPFFPLKNFFVGNRSMKLKFESIFRAYLFVLVILFCWSFWAVAQTNSATNAVVIKATGADTGIVSIPAILDKEVVVTFGLDRVSWLKPKLWGNPRWQYLAFAIYIFLAFYFSKLLDYLLNV